MRDDSIVLLLLPYLAIGLAATADLVTGPSFGLLPLLALGPAFASLKGGVGHAVTVGLLSLIASMLLSFYDGLFGTTRGTSVFIAVFGTGVASLVATHLRRRQQQQLTRARAVAKVAQQILLPEVPATLHGVRLAASYSSASPDARVGGDFYEVVNCHSGVRAVIGDVQGKGLSAVERAALVLGAYRVAACDEGTLAEVGRCLERTTGRYLVDEAFATVVLAELARNGTVTLLNYGHPPPLIVRRDGTTSFAQAQEPALPLGLTEFEGERPLPYEVVLDLGDQMLLYTDGTAEARNAAGEFYPLAERASLLATADASFALQTLRDDVIAHTDGPLVDDAAILLLRR